MVPTCILLLLTGLLSSSLASDEVDCPSGVDHCFQEEEEENEDGAFMQTFEVATRKASRSVGASIPEELTPRGAPPNATPESLATGTTASQSQEPPELAEVEAADLEGGLRSRRVAPPVGDVAALRHGGNAAVSGAKVAGAAGVVAMAQTAASAKQRLPRGAGAIGTPRALDFEGTTAAELAHSSPLARTFAKAASPQVDAQTLWRMLWGAFTLAAVLALATLSYARSRQKKSGKAAGPEAAQEVQQAPKPAPRLSHCGTSFVIPISQIKDSKKANACFDVSVWPAVWPFRATLWRNDPESDWETIELTVDIIAAAGLPPLLLCRRANEHCGAKAEDAAIETGATAGAKDEGTPWLHIRDGSGNMVASIKSTSAGRYRLHRDGFPTWAIEAQIHGGDLSIIVRQNGQEIGMTTSYDDPTKTDEEYIQLDSMPDAESPESSLILMSTLAMLSFGEASW